MMKKYLTHSKQAGKTLLTKYETELELSKGNKVLVIDSNKHCCLIVPGPWKYQPSYIRDSYK